MKRSSGGGAVLIAPGAQVWVDVWLPCDDPLWEEDVVRSSSWLGRAWCDALEEQGVGDLEVHEGRLARTEMSDLVCFAGLGPGEATWKGRKLVGISQRRVKQGARFQTVSPLELPGATLLDALDTDARERKAIAAALAGATTCLRDATGQAAVDDASLTARLEDSLIRAISRAGR
jgi:lipoate-protein ligase A